MFLDKKLLQLANTNTKVYRRILQMFLKLTNYVARFAVSGSVEKVFYIDFIIIYLSSIFFQ